MRPVHTRSSAGNSNARLGASIPMSLSRSRAASPDGVVSGTHLVLPMEVKDLKGHR